MSQKSEDNKNHTRRTFEVREETIFDYLMHAATREDIANLRSEVKDDVSRLDSKIENLRKETKEDFKELTKKVDIQFRWMMGILLIAVMAPFVAKFIT